MAGPCRAIRAAICGAVRPSDRHRADRARCGAAARAEHRCWARRRSRWTGRACCRASPPATPRKPRTQYFEIGGKIGLYHNGWFLSGDDGRTLVAGHRAGRRAAARSNGRSTISTKDFSQSTDLAAQEPARLAGRCMDAVASRRRSATTSSRSITASRAARADRAAMRRIAPQALRLLGQGCQRARHGASRSSIGAQLHADADLVLDKPEASGAVLAWGSHFGGWSLYLDTGRPSLHLVPARPIRRRWRMSRPARPCRRARAS